MFIKTSPSNTVSTLEGLKVVVKEIKSVSQASTQRRACVIPSWATLPASSIPHLS